MDKKYYITEIQLKMLMMGADILKSPTMTDLLNKIEDAQNIKKVKSE